MTETYNYRSEEADSQTEAILRQHHVPLLARITLQCRRTGLIGYAVALLVGILLGSLITKGRQESGRTDPDSLSTNFLQTARGALTLETLHKEFIVQGPKTTLQHLQQLIEQDSEIATSCHSLAHALGRKALNERGFDDAFGGMPGTPDASLLRICNAAYMHGIIESHLAASTNLMTDVTSISDKICDTFAASPSGKWECQLAVGHGITHNLRRDHDEQVLAEALVNCDKTPFDVACENGVWIDHFSSTRVLGDEPLEPSSLHICSDIAKSPVICATYAPTEFLLHHPRAYMEAIQFCHSGYESNELLAMTCVMGVGMQAAKENPHDYLPVEEACVTAPEDERASCFGTAIYYYTKNTGQSTLPLSLCENLVVFRDICKSAAGRN